VRAGLACEESKVDGIADFEGSAVFAAIERVMRVARRFAASGLISSSPIPIIRRHLNNKPAFFVQVGSNDGLSGDPLHSLILGNPLWRGIFIEPVEYAYRKLVENYGPSERFIYEQIAIAEEAGDREFYFISEQALQDPSIPPLSDKLGSFNRSHITKHSPLLEKYMRSTKVRCEPLESVLTKHNVARIDIMHIDVEGYDYRVLRQIDFNRHKPRLVLFEHTHLNPDELSKSYELLSYEGYNLVNCGLDTMAIRVRD
jgi:FkbM family methyltransferase